MSVTERNIRMAAPIAGYLIADAVYFRYALYQGLVAEEMLLAYVLITGAALGSWFALNRRSGKGTRRTITIVLIALSLMAMAFASINRSLPSF